MGIKNNLACLTQFPILGLQSDGEPFEYLIKDINSEYIQIAIYNWFVNRTLLKIGEEVDLLISNLLSELVRNDLGKVTEIIYNSEKQAIEYKIVFDVVLDQAPLENRTWENSLDTLSTHELLLQCVKDTKLLKSGIRIYYRHLNAYFSRISPLNLKEYAKINLVLFRDIESHIKLNENKLYELHKYLEKNLTCSDEIPIILDLEQLREMIESEISLLIFKHIFSEGEFPKQMDISIDNLSKHPCIAYLAGIKALERRLYLNYNMIVTIYSYSLSIK